MKAEEYLKGRFWYDPSGQMVFIERDYKQNQIFVDVRGWGAIQHLFPNTEEGQKEAGKFQDAIGQWIANALNEKAFKGIELTIKP